MGADRFRYAEPAVDNGTPALFTCFGTFEASMHAYGLAIDVDTVENPYIQPGQPIDPPSSAAYANRSDIRPGMAYPGGVLVSAFSSIGWGWGGNWTGSPD